MGVRVGARHLGNLRRLGAAGGQGGAVVRHRPAVAGRRGDGRLGEGREIGESQPLLDLADFLQRLVRWVFCDVVFTDDAQHRELFAFLGRLGLLARARIVGNLGRQRPLFRLGSWGLERDDVDVLLLFFVSCDVTVLVGDDHLLALDVLRRLRLLHQLHLAIGLA